MARQLGPDEKYRVIYSPTTGLAHMQGAKVPLYADAALSTAADVRTTTGGAVPTVAGIPTLTVDAYSKVPEFLFPDVTNPVVWTRINGGPATAWYPNGDARITALETRMTAAEGAAGGALVKSANLSDLANAGTARTNLGLGSAATQASTAFDAAGVGAATAATAQAYAIQRANHTGTESADVLTDGTTNKAFLATERTKLAGVATGATANATDAQLRDRSTHTGTQSADTLTDGTTNKAFLATERTKLTGVATGATANSSDATLLARANHTGTQAVGTITGLGGAATLNVGTAAGTVAAGDAAPNPHAASHGVGGTDAISPASLGVASTTGAVPGDIGWAGWSMDPVLAQAAALSSTAGSVFVARIKLVSTGTLSKVWLSLGAGAVTPTTGQNFVAVFSAAGAQLGVSADLSALIGSPGVIGFSLASATASQTVGTVVYAAWLFNAATPPTLGRMATGVNQFANLSAAQYRHAVAATTQTSMPGSLTPSGFNSIGAALYWVAVS